MRAKMVERWEWTTILSHTLVSRASDILLGLEQHSTEQHTKLKTNDPRSNWSTKQTPEIWNKNELFGNPLDKFEMIMIIDWIVVNQFSMAHSKGSNFYVWDDESMGHPYMRELHM